MLAVQNGICAPERADANAAAQGRAAISGNHGHSLSIAAADLDSTTAKTYSIQGAATHDHLVTLSPAQLATLKAGGSVTVTSTTTLAHDHAVTITCA